MLATSLRIVPDIALACLVSAAAKVTLSPSRFTTTWEAIDCFRVPSGPFTVSSAWPTVTSTFSGITTGYLAIRDMALPLDHDAEHFAAHTGLARPAVGHHAPRGRDDRHAEAVHDRANVLAALVDAKPRARDALDLFDHGLAGVVLEPDFDDGLAFEVAHREVLDVALVLQHLRDGALHLRCRHHDAHLFGGLRVANAGQHVGDGVTHAHIGAPTSSP